jgi:hypothetical protein
MNEVQREAILDRRVQIALAVDRRYRYAASAAQQAIVESLVEVEQEIKLLRESRRFAGSLQYAGQIAELERRHAELHAELDELEPVL